MDSMALYYPDGHQKHNLNAHPERPERVEMMKKGLMEIGLWESSIQLDPIDIEDSVLETVHDQEYLYTLERASSRAQMLDPDTYTTLDSWMLALNAAGGAIAVADQVWDRKVKNGFALTRPPGHHATRYRGMGFCLINNIAVAAEYLVQKKGAGRVGIVDLDLHHGNGTQDIFWERPDITYVSIHQSPFYPGTGAINETGAGKGEGSTLNLPIPSYSGDNAYQTLMGDIVYPYLDRQQLDMLLISFGFDIHWKDPLGSMLVTAGGIYQMIIEAKSWAEKNCSGRLGIYLEGGYDLDAGFLSGQAVGAALSGVDWDSEQDRSPEEETDHWRETYSAAKTILGN